MDQFMAFQSITSFPNHNKFGFNHIYLQHISVVTTFMRLGPRSSLDLYIYEKLKGCWQMRAGTARYYIPIQIHNTHIAPENTRPK